MKIVANLIMLGVRIHRRLWMYIQRPLFGSCGKNFRFGHGSDFSYSSIFVGDHVYIGPHASFSAAHSKIIIKSKVIFGPHVRIMGGDHRADLLGRYMYDIKENEKLRGNDADVIIEDDVWVGTGAIILKGVTIGRGSIVGAGTVVAKPVPPYSIVVGNPARIVRARFAPEAIAAHEALLRANGNVRI